MFTLGKHTVLSTLDTYKHTQVYPLQWLILVACSSNRYSGLVAAATAAVDWFTNDRLVAARSCASVHTHSGQLGDRAKVGWPETFHR